MKTTIKQSVMVVSTAPASIWLDLGFDPSDEDEVSFHKLHDVTWSHDNATGYGIEYVRVDTTQPQRTWVGLTDDEINEIYEQAETLVHDSWFGKVGLMFPITLCKMFEDKLKEKNNG